MGAMFGGRKKRVEKLSAEAMANLEDGESIRELVQTQTGQALTFGGIKFHVMALFGEHADRLYDYVKQSGGATESRPGSADTAVSAREQRIRNALED
jgi:hypothetical protein